MNGIARLVFGLLAFSCLQYAWAGAANSGIYEECIGEPVFEGHVCTVQANRDAKAGVILIHGLDGSYADWQRVIPALATDFHVLAFDLPGFGKSDKGSKDYSPTRYARLAQFLAAHYFKDKPFHIVGHSMGGAIALRFAAQHPPHFQRLVLVDAAGILHPLAITKFQAGSMVENASGVEQTRGIVERLSGKVLAQMQRLPILPTDISESALGRDYLLRGGPSKIAALNLAGEDFSGAIQSVAEPTLVIWGDRDMVAPLRTGKVLAANMPRARLEIISGSGHEPMVDQPKRLNALIRTQLLASATALAEYYQPPQALPALDRERAATCSGKSGIVFEGDYRSIELRDCTGITIHDARIAYLSVINSRAEIEDTDILGQDVGLLADNSYLTITNGEISGEIAIDAAHSRLDLAGVSLKGTQASVKGVDSKLICSVCRVNSPVATGNLHTFKEMVDEKL